MILSDQTDGDVQDFVGMAMSHTIDAMYGLPEYGGNRDLVGWTTTGWPGDVQPRGYTRRRRCSSDPDPAPATPLSAGRRPATRRDRFLGCRRANAPATRGPGLARLPAGGG